MNKKLFYGILGAGVLAIVIIGTLMLNTPFDMEGDPFGAPPEGISFSCGPEDRYKFEETINSKNDFVNFIKNNEINQWVRLDNFRDYIDVDDVPTAINWEDVITATKIEKVGSRTVYALDYNPQSCSGFTLKMTNDGHVSVYGCCGK